MILKQTFYLSESFRQDIESKLGTYNLSAIPSSKLYGAIESVLQEKYLNSKSSNYAEFKIPSGIRKERFNLVFLKDILYEIAKHPGKYNEKELRNSFVNKYNNKINRDKASLSNLIRYLSEIGIIEFNKNSVSAFKTLDKSDYRPDYKPINPKEKSRNDWVNKTSVAQMQTVETIYRECPSLSEIGFILNYKDHYIGLSKYGRAKNFIKFRPRQRYTYLECYRISSISEYEEKLRQSLLNFSFDERKRCLKIKLSNEGEYLSNQDLIDSIIISSLYSTKSNI